MTTLKNKFLKEYIICFLFQEVESVINQYIKLLDKYKVCGIQYLDPEGENTFRFFEDQILSFLNNILEDEPLKDIERIIEKWKNSKHNTYCNHHIAYEDLITNYTILKETLIVLLEEYTKDYGKINLITNDLELLDQKIQEYITDQYRGIQMHLKNKPD